MNLCVTADMSTNISNCTNVTSDDGKNLHEGNEIVNTSSHVAIIKESHCDDKKNMSTASSNVSIASVQLTKLNTTRINEVSQANLRKMKRDKEQILKDKE